MRSDEVQDFLPFRPVTADGKMSQLHAEKNLASISYEKMLETYKINVFGHLLVYKHFTPLLPHRKQTKGDGEDPAMGVVPPGRSTLVSLSARVGSIGDNERGG